MIWWTVWTATTIFYLCSLPRLLMRECLLSKPSFDFRWVMGRHKGICFHFYSHHSLEVKKQIPLVLVYMRKFFTQLSNLSGERGCCSLNAVWKTWSCSVLSLTARKRLQLGLPGLSTWLDGSQRSFHLNWAYWVQWRLQQWFHVG